MQFWTPALRAEAKSQKKLDDERWARKQKRLLSDDIGLKVMALLQENSDNPTCCRTCLTCKKVCRSTRDWLRHEGTEVCKMQQCKNEGREYVPPPPPKCDVCDKEYKNEYCLARHMQTAAHKKQMTLLKHGLSLYCEKCEMTFNSTRSLNRHLKTKKHLFTKEDLFCSLCEIQFKNKKTLRQHKKSKKHADAFSGTGIAVPKKGIENEN